MSPYFLVCFSSLESTFLYTWQFARLLSGVIFVIKTAVRRHTVILCERLKFTSKSLYNSIKKLAKVVKRVFSALCKEMPNMFAWETKIAPSTKRREPIARFVAIRNASTSA